MKRSISLFLRPELTGLLIVSSLLVAACSSPATASGYPTAGGIQVPDGTPMVTPPAPSGTPAGSTPVTGGTPAGEIPITGAESVRVANNSQLGQILVTPDGKTLYTNTVDTPDHLQCTNFSCTAFWKPYVVNTQPTAGNQVPGSLGLITRPDGAKQVTYNQQPLYTFYLDTSAGDVRGNGFTDFGGTWHVVTVGSP